MTRSTATKKLTLRRFATFTAALGALVMSSGIALMVTATPAQAANKVGICHATSSDSNPYVFISVDDDSVKLKGHLAHKLTPNKTWKNAGTFNGIPHLAGAPKGDLIGSFTDDQGVFHLYDGNITKASCEGAVAVVEATADVDFTDPSCANKNVVSYDTTGTHVTFSIKSGAAAPNTDIVVTAVADPGTTFDGGATFQDFPHHFGNAVDLNAAPCATADATASVSFTDPTCANQNTVDYSTLGDHVTFAKTAGQKAAGQDIQITATADAGHTFGDLTTTKVFTHHFTDALDLNGPPCVIVGPPGDVADTTAAVSFVDPTCANLNEASYSGTGEHVTFAVTSGSETPGADIEVTATADAGHTFADLSTTKAFTHTFGAAVDLNAEPCVNVEPPIVIPPIVTPPIVTPPSGITPTVVHSGIVTPDLHSEQGLALLVAGMILMLVAGGLGLAPARRTRN